MDGEIWVESEINQGSQFMFTVKTRINQDISSLMLHERVKPFIGRSIICIGSEVTSNDLQTIKSLGMVPVLFKSVGDVRNKDLGPMVDAIIVDSIDAVSSSRHGDYLKFDNTSRSRKFENSITCATSPLCS